MTAEALRGVVNGATLCQVDTIRPREHPNLLIVAITDGDGRVGLGETFYGASTVEAWVHDTAAPVLLGADSSRIERLGRASDGYVGAGSPGVESRGRSAVDIALWDLAGQRVGRPLCELLGGAVHDKLQVYNTCAGYRYVRRLSRQHSENWGLDGPLTGPYEDLLAVQERPVELAHSLLDQGVTAMKVWPFDRFAEASSGRYISAADLRVGLEPLQQIADACEGRMELLVELHGLWDPTPARQISAALDSLGVFWIEDPISTRNLDALATLTAATRTRIAVGETLAGLDRYRELCEKRAADVVIADVCWGGGVTAARKVAAVAEAYGLPVALHDCTGPISFAATVHVAASLPNTLIQESVRAYYSSWYQDLVTGLPELADGAVSPSPAPGIGLQLTEDLVDRPDVVVRSSRL